MHVGAHGIMVIMMMTVPHGRCGGVKIALARGGLMIVVLPKKALPEKQHGQQAKANQKKEFPHASPKKVLRF